MFYTLPDGRKVVLEDIVRISKVRDQGDDENSIGMSKMSFKIHMRNDEIIEIAEQYHFADWGKKKQDLEKIYADILDKWQKATGLVDTD